MKSKLIWEQKGSLNIFLLIVLSALLFFHGIMVDYVRVYAASNRTEQLARANARSLLADYDLRLREYGLFANAQSKQEMEGIALQLFQMHDVAHQYRTRLSNDLGGTRTNSLQVNDLTVMGPYSPQVKVLNNLAEQNLFLQQIDKEMTIRAPIAWTGDFMQAIGKKNNLPTLTSSELKKAETTLNDLKKREHLESQLYRHFKKLAGDTEKWSKLEQKKLKTSMLLITKLQKTNNMLSNNKIGANMLIEPIAEETLLRIKKDIVDGYALVKGTEQFKNVQLFAEWQKKIDHFFYENWCQELEQIEQGRDALVQLQSQLLTAIAQIPLIDKSDPKNSKLKQFSQQSLAIGELLLLVKNILEKVQTQFMRLERFAHILQEDLRTIENMTKKKAQRDRLVSQTLINQEQKRKDTFLIKIGNEPEKPLTQLTLAEINMIWKSLNGLGDQFVQKKRLYKSISDYTRIYSPSASLKSAAVNNPLSQSDELNLDSISGALQSYQKYNHSLSNKTGLLTSLYRNEYPLQFFNYGSYFNELPQKQKTEINAHPLHYQLSLPFAIIAFNDQPEKKKVFRFSQQLGEECEYILYGFEQPGLNLITALSELMILRTGIRFISLVLSYKGALPFGWVGALNYALITAFNDTMQLIMGQPVDFIPNHSLVTLDYKDYLRLFFLVHDLDSEAIARMQALIHHNTKRNLQQMAVAIELLMETRVKLLFTPFAERGGHAIRRVVVYSY